MYAKIMCGYRLKNNCFFRAGAGVCILGQIIARFLRNLVIAQDLPEGNFGVDTFLVLSSPKIKLS